MTTIPGLTTTLTSVDRAADLFEVSDTSDSGNSKKTSINNMLDLTSHPVGLTDVQVLTGKTLTAPTISSPVLSGTVTGTYTLAGTPTFPAAVVTLTGSQTLTNKVLISPTISAPTITNPTITVDTVNEFTSANGVTVDGLSIKDGKLNTNDSVVTANITNSSVTGAKLSTYKVLRQNDASNVTETGARILTGWGVMAYDTGANAVMETVTFSSSFTNIPIITVSIAGDNSTNTGYGTGGNIVEGKLSIKSTSQSISGFTVYLHQGGGSNFGAGFVYYTWIAVGE